MKKLDDCSPPIGQLVNLPIGGPFSPDAGASTNGLALIEGWMVLLETAVVAVDGLGTCLFCDVHVTFRGRPLFRSGATGEVFMSLTGIKAEVW
ncbi:hypothetical protein TNCV_1079911 [Trichonephila clavipes]|nr:hypothetical protein TNCV_1079911 [Trichonephila clavipes]